jgi:branched-chain amino acid aminotransferase
MSKIRLWAVKFLETGATLEAIAAAKGLQSLDETASFLPEGAYTTFRTYQHTRALHLEDHFLRLEETARLAGKSLRMERLALRQALRQALANYPHSQELRLRLVLDLFEQPGAIYLAAEPLHVLPASAYRMGVKTITCDFSRPNPKAKLTTSMSGARELRRQLPQDVNEALMLDDYGRFLEGLSSNFFAVLAGEIWTAEAGVLSGITRQLVLEEIRLARLPLRLEGLPRSALPELHEAFITSASRAILPVTQIDAQIIGAGAPGPLTRLLARRYRSRVRQDVEAI